MIRRSYRLLAMPSACALLALACSLGGSGSSSDQVGDITPQPAAATSIPSEGELKPQQFSINQQFWHSGFHVQLEDGRYYNEKNELTDRVRYFVSIAASFENLGDDDFSYFGTTSIVWGGNSAPTLLNSDFPTVSSGQAANGEFVFEVDEAFDPASAQLIVGSSEENQAQVPLGPDGGDLVSLEPTEPPISGSISMELIDLSFKSAEMRADIPDSYREVEAGKLALTLHYDATSRAAGNWSILGQDFSLTLPNGKTIAPDGGPVESLQGSAGGIDTTDLSVRFQVDDPPDGMYTLRFTPGNWFIGSDGVTEGAIDFEIQ
jgi:hypothetical protein